MRGDVQGRAVVVPCIVRQQPQVHLLDDPRRGGLEVIQKNIRHLRLLQGQAPGADILPQQSQRRIGAVHLLQNFQGPLLPGHGGVDVIQQQHGRRLHRQALPPGQYLRRTEQCIQLGPGTQLQRQVRRRIQQLQCHLIVQLLRPPQIRQHRRQKPLLPSGAAGEQGLHAEFQGEPDPPPVLGHQLMIRIDDLLQIQPPLIQIRHRPQIRTAVRRTLLGVACVEPCDDLPHESRRLTADVPLTVHQQFIEKGQRLHLLGNVQIQGVGLEHPQIGPQPPPVGLTTSLLQQGGKAPLPGKPVHQLHVVGHTLHGQGLQHLRILHQGHRLLRQRLRVRPLHGHVHSPADHIRLEVLQAGVNSGVAAALLPVHVV